jgi:hypothetical protein
MKILYGRGTLFSPTAIRVPGAGAQDNPDQANDDNEPAVTMKAGFMTAVVREIRPAAPAFRSSRKSKRPLHNPVAVHRALSGAQREQSHGAQVRI